MQEEGEARDSLKFHATWTASGLALASKERDDELKTSKGEVHTLDEVGHWALNILLAMMCVRW